MSKLEFAAARQLHLMIELSSFSEGKPCPAQLIWMKGRLISFRPNFSRRILFQDSSAINRFVLCHVHVNVVC